MQLIHTIRHADIDLESGKFLNRTATRAIVIDGDDILLLYTRRYEFLLRKHRQTAWGYRCNGKPGC